MTAQTEEQAFAMSAPKSVAKNLQGRYVLAWTLCLVFYFLQYALRSAPGVMVPELRAAFGLSALGLSSVLGLHYYTYAGFAIVAGATLDRYGGRLPIGVGILGVAAGSILFGLGSIAAAEAGQLLQGAGSAFAFTGAIYMASHGVPDRWLATVNEIRGRLDAGYTKLADFLPRSPSMLLNHTRAAFAPGSQRLSR